MFNNCLKIEIDLLEQCCEIYKNNELSKTQSGENFNIFEICNINDKEVIMCKFFAEIINPHGTNPYARQMLESFCDKILKIEKITDFSKVFVKTEYKTDEKRRIDIVIETPDMLIPIEVKIYAKDQDSQCKSYYDYANKHCIDKNVKVYYLTLDGHLPQKEGVRGLTPIIDNDEIIGYKEITPLSFVGDISEWIDEFVRENVIEEKIANSLLQFKNAIERSSFKMDTEYIEKLVAVMSNDSQSIIAAHNIAKHYDEARLDMIKKILGVLDKKIIDKFKLEKINTDYEYTDNKLIADYFKHQKSTYPGMTYRIKTIGKDLDLCFRVEIDYNIFCGYVVVTTKNDKNEFLDEITLTDEEIKYHLNGKILKDGEWLYWEFLPIANNDDETPNFKMNNQAFFDLYNEEKFNIFIDKSINTIEELLNGILFAL